MSPFWRLLFAVSLTIDFPSHQSKIRDRSFASKPVHPDNEYEASSDAEMRAVYRVVMLPHQSLVEYSSGVSIIEQRTLGWPSEELAVRFALDCPEQDLG